MSIQKLVASHGDIDDQFILSLGAAVYFFSRAEWASICCCHAMDGEYANSTGGDKKPYAFNVAQKLISLTEKLGKSEERNALLAAAKDFMTLATDERNALLHSYPATIDGTHELHNAKDNKSYNADALEDYAQRAAECSNTLTRLFNTFLKA